MDKWVIDGFRPPMLKITAGPDIPLTKLVKHWYLLNAHLPNSHTGCLKVSSSLKVPMDLYPALPDFQLPFVKPSKFELLVKDILLTDFTSGDKVLHKAVMFYLNDGMERSRFSTDITGLSFVTHFDPSRCKSLHSGHLKQLAIVCPNLEHLNLLGNDCCLENLQGLNVIAACCKNLQGLNLVDVSVDKHQVVIEFGKSWLI